MRSESSSSAAAQAGMEALALPQAADPSYYTARDLDSYPRLVVALDINRLVNRAVGIPSPTIRLELIIDEHGIVNHVTFAAPGIPGVLETELRAAIAATRFIPARKDGRAVKSRVLMSINFETGD